MARTQNPVKTQKMQISTTPQVCEVLELLAKTGRFGKTATEVGEELLRAKMREVELQGWLERPRPSRGRGQRGVGAVRT